MADSPAAVTPVVEPSPMPAPVAAPVQPGGVRLPPPPVPIPATIRESLNRLKLHQVLLGTKSIGEFFDDLAYAIERTPVHHNSSAREPLPKNIELANALRAFIAQPGVQTYKQTIGIIYSSDPPIPSSRGQIQQPSGGYVIFMSDSLPKPHERVKFDDLTQPDRVAGGGPDALSASEVPVSVSEE